MRERRTTTWSRMGVLLVAASLVLSACGGRFGEGSDSSSTAEAGTRPNTAGSEAVEKVELDFWTFWGSETLRPIIEKIIEDFNQSQDRIVVKHTYLPWGDILTKNLAAIAAGNPPDVIVNDIATVAQRAENKQAADLSSYIEQEPVEDRFFPELWRAVVHE
ncbi:hypothetical protein PATA110616_21235 [Paenibacillus tarimensis]